MKVSPSLYNESFDFEIEPRSIKTIEVPMKKGNILTIFGKITSQSIFGAPKIEILLVREVDKPPETLPPDRQRDVLRQKAFHNKKVAADFVFEYTTIDTEPILLFFDNNHPIATRSANIIIQILEKEEEKESKHHSPMIIVPEKKYSKITVSKKTASKIAVPEKPAPEIVVPEKTLKRILGVLKSFQTVSMKELTAYSNLDIDVTRNIVFEMIADDQVSGRFNSKTDSFVSVSAASASREIRSDHQSIAKCMYCGKPLEKALKSGDEVKCPSCGIINIG